MTTAQSISSVLAELGHDPSRITQIDVASTNVTVGGSWKDARPISAIVDLVTCRCMQQKLGIESVRAYGRSRDKKGVTIFVSLDTLAFNENTTKFYNHLACELLDSSRMVTTLTMYSDGLDPDGLSAAIAAATRSPTLKKVIFNLNYWRGDVTLAPFTDAFMTLLSENKVIDHIAVHSHRYYDQPRPKREVVRTKTLNSLANNWSVITIHITDMICSKEHWDAVQAILARNKNLQRPNIHTEVIKYVKAILPLGLSPYELLWILDWIPPLHYRFPYKGDNDYDPRHVQKIRLIEGLTRSYTKLTE